ncbi:MULTISPECIES: MurR/RpiR family transcriptional regulator [Enterococcus]|uniref:MurR/RpiR family transcriptional regulator n=1 Tax=Candidatus Enterococcus murrayae TaxID=2815321 RepID=A0ABS3HGU7_9ENTE|nr:MurR/RpiR family transcriptional regulator [Enterococcus sp. MJM16]MBO0452675.1 MurR/RpiR family transcriptional regulator [Enterococcus sp. MJM16]
MLADILDNEVLTSLNPNERAILHYIYTNPHVVENATIRELADQLTVSTTTILRFCKKIRLAGYSELKYIIKQDKAFYTKETLKKKPNSALLQEMSQEIENTLLLMKNQTVQQMIEILNSSRHIHLYSGGGISGRVLDYWEKMLFSYGRQNVYRYEASRLAFHIAETLTEQDVLFVISCSGTYEPTIRMANLAKMRGATVVAITPYTDNVLATTADLTFRFFGHPRQNKNTEFTSRLPIFFIIDTIFKAYLASLEGISIE